VSRRRWFLYGGTLLLAGAAAVRVAGGSAPQPPPPAAATGPAPGPSPTAAMVCQAEVRGDIAEALGLPAPPPTRSTWSGGTFTCTYQLTQGRLVLSVHESTDPGTARGYLATLRDRSTPTAAAPGLTDGAFRTPTGTVALSKDNDTLVVDATALPPQFGPQQQKRTDLAYEVASLVLGCWTGDD
jgi:hypothetical protein